jgi:hypothetical protein
MEVATPRLARGVTWHVPITAQQQDGEEVAIQEDGAWSSFDYLLVEHLSYSTEDLIFQCLSYCKQ